MSGLPPLNLSGGHAQASTGATGAPSVTGDFVWKRDDWKDQLTAAVPLAVLGLSVWLIFRKKK